MNKKRINLFIALTLVICIFVGSNAFALNFTGSQGNDATFETLEETRVSSPKAVATLDTNEDKVFQSHPALDGYPQGTTYVYRSANMYGGRAAARMNTNLVVYAEQHFDSKDDAYSYLEDAGLISLVDEAVGSIVLVTPIGDTFTQADVAGYYALQTAMLAQKDFIKLDDDSSIYYSDAEYFGGYGYLYFIGVEGGATFFNNYIATTYDFVSRIAGAVLIGGQVDEIRKVASFVPVWLVNPNEMTLQKYKDANGVDAVKGSGDIVTYYCQRMPLRQVVTSTMESVNLTSAIERAYYDMLINAMRVPVVLQAMHSAGTPFSGYNFDEAPYSLCERNALINGVTANGIHLITHQGENRFDDIKTPSGEYMDTWYEYLPEEVLNGTAPTGTVPLILANHGGGDDARLFVDEMGLLALAGNERIAVVAADHQNIAEVRGPALAALVEYMLETYPALDASRVYAEGYSMGGFATYIVGTYKPSLFAAIASVAGSNYVPTDEEAAVFDQRELPIYLSTSSYDIRRLDEMCGRINDNLAGQVNRWAAYNGIEPVEFDFERYPLSGFEGDSWLIETLNDEYISNNWYLENQSGVPMVALNYVKDLIHALYPEYANITWEYMKHFARDQKTGEILYNPYIR